MHAGADQELGNIPGYAYAISQAVTPALFPDQHCRSSTSADLHEEADATVWGEEAPGMLSTSACAQAPLQGI